MAFDLIIVTKSREEGYSISKQLLDEERQRTGEIIHGNGLLGVDENVLTGAFGLHAPPQYWANIRDKERFHTLPRTPLWVNVEFITGSPSFGIGPWGPG